MMTVNSVSSGQIFQGPTTKVAATESTSLFGEVWDAINPLQHIPIVSSIYRAVSGTDISAFANIAGSTLYGGPIGGAIAAVQEGVSAIGDAILGGEEKATQVATASNAPATLASTNPVKASSKPKLHPNTKEWMTKNLNEASTQTIVQQPASHHYKVLASTAEWLNGHTSSKAAIASA